jgi:hypothetical protein
VRRKSHAPFWSSGRRSDPPIDCNNEDDLGKALKQVKNAGLIPEETVRLCVIGDGADWMWKHVQALFPDACQVLDSYHCSEYLHKMAYTQYGHTLQALEWIEST